MEVKKQKIAVAPNTIGTHSGTFHCDEILAVYLLSKHVDYQNHSVLRTRDQSLLDQCDIIVDVGSIFDVESKRFDHHQKTFSETFKSLRSDVQNISGGNIRLSSAGLVYVHFGEKIISDMLKNTKNLDLTPSQLKSIFVKIYQSFVQEIDGIDNGVPQFEGEPVYRINSHLSSRVKNFNPAWMDEKTPEEVDELFHQAKAYVGKEFDEKVTYFATSWLPARKIVEQSIANRFTVHASGKIIELNRFCPWQEHLREIEKEIGDVNIEFVLFNSGSNDFRVQCVPCQEGSFICRKFLKKSWWGVRDEELEAVSNIHGIKFCHATGFIGGHSTRDGSLKMAENSLDADD